MNKDQLIALINKGLSSYEIAKELEVSNTKIWYWFDKHKIREFYLNFPKNRGKVVRHIYEEMEFRTVVSNSHNYAQILSHYGRTATGASRNSVKQHIERYKIDISHFYKKYVNPHLKRKMTNDEWFVKGVKRNSSDSKERFCEFTKYECVECGLKNEWNNKQLILQLDHIDGNNSNNEVENLRFLCPNCHSQTKTYAGKCRKNTIYCSCGGEKKTKTSKGCVKCHTKRYRKVKDRPSKEQLILELSISNYVQVGKKYGVSDNAVRKWLK